MEYQIKELMKVLGYEQFDRTTIGDSVTTVFKKDEEYIMLRFEQSSYDGFSHISETKKVKPKQVTKYEWDTVR